MSEIVRNYLDSLALLESPIERQFFMAFALLRGTRKEKLGPVIVGVQKPIEIDGRRYRVDITLRFEDVQIAIECDGHDFHERTKEQAEHDRSRDRALGKAGWLVLRFTGREIHRDALKCAEEVLEAVQAHRDRAHKP
jgi:very-short-patch-repair endonuclease